MNGVYQHLRFLSVSLSEGSVCVQQDPFNGTHSPGGSLLWCPSQYFPEYGCLSGCYLFQRAVQRKKLAEDITSELPATFTKQRE